MKRETLRKILTRLSTILARVEFSGTENLPPEGGLIIATNHMSRVDTLLLFTNSARTDITALVADKYKKYPLFNWVLTVGGVIFLDRDKADFGAFRVAVEWINKGVAMGIAPEGTRSSNGQLQQGKPGVILLAQKTGAPIVPVGIAGTETFFHDLLRLRRPRVRITFGPAYNPPPLDRANRDESLKQSTDEIMARIAALIPEKYWGYYKDYPRVRQLMAEAQSKPTNV